MQAMESPVRGGDQQHMMHQQHAQPAMPDFSSFFGSKTLSDCTITIATLAPCGTAADGDGTTDAMTPSAKRHKGAQGAATPRAGAAPDAAAAAAAPAPATAQADVLPGHAIVLCTASPWMRRQVEAWSARAGGGENAPPPATLAAAAAAGGQASTAGGGLFKAGGVVGSALAAGAAAVTSSAHHHHNQQQQQQQPNITLHVRPGQEEAARRLVRFIYEGPGSAPTAAAASAPGAAGRATQALLVDMLALAHTYRVAACGACCLARLLSVPLPSLAWATVSQVLRLPRAQLAGADGARLAAACLDKLHGDFGDLEAVAADPSLLARFAALPFQAVLQLLLDERTGAASENTALMLAHAWLAAQPAGVAGPDERRALAGAVRVPQLAPLMLATVAPRLPWLADALGVEGLALAAGAARAVGDPLAEPVLRDHVPAAPPAWLRGARPVPPSVAGPGGRARAAFEWAVPLHQLRQLYEDTVAAAAAAEAARIAADDAAVAADERAWFAQQKALADPRYASGGGGGGEASGGSAATGGTLSLLGGLLGWGRRSTGGGGGSVTSTPTKRPLQEAPAAAGGMQPYGGGGSGRAQAAGGATAPAAASLKLRSPPCVFAGHVFRLVLYCQRCESASGAGAGGAGAGAGAGNDDDTNADGAGAQSAGGGGSRSTAGARGKRARGGSARAAAEEQAAPTPRKRGGAAAAAAAAAAAQQKHKQQSQQQPEQADEGAAAGAAGADEPYSGWTLRLAVEAAPCVPLRGPASVVGFSGRLSALRAVSSPARSAATVTAGAGGRSGGRSGARAAGGRGRAGGRASRIIEDDDGDDDDNDNNHGSGSDGAAASEEDEGGGSSAGAKTGTAYDDDDEDEDGGNGGQGYAWETRELPGGSWVRSRACDTGFRDFFGARLPAARWSAAPLRRYLVGPDGGSLRLRCECENVR